MRTFFNIIFLRHVLIKRNDITFGEGYVKLTRKKMPHIFLKLDNIWEAKKES